ncbi:MAG: hypothetical protein EOO09_12705 [Chitinophagaceae bacterium]|nr:MAG: hypothetical protein EOO09_12705 [Chitinophagaceae bacterium]
MMYLLTTGQLIYSLCQALIHSTWMGLLLALAAAGVLLATRKSAAQLRYLLFGGLMILFLLAAAAVFCYSWMQFGGGSTDAMPGHRPGETGSAAMLGFALSGFTAWLMENAVWVVSGWMVVVGFKMLRLFADWMYVSRIRGSQVYGVGEYWEKRTAELATAMGIRKVVGILESALVKVPVVTGHLRPLILIPVGIINHLPAAEVEAVLLHELAHIRRYDYFVNILQRIAELFFFFNPGLLWVSSLIRDERENCCDDLAIGASGDRAVFVQALVSFREYSLRPALVAMSFPGTRGQLVHRLTRIVYNRNKGLTGREAGFVSFNLVMLVLLLCMINVPLVSTNAVNGITTTVLPVPVVRLPVNIAQANATTEIKQTIANRIKKPSRVAAAAVPTSNRSATQEVFSPVIKSFDQPGPGDSKQVNNPEELRRRSDADRLNAERDRQQAELDREQAARDRVQAGKDREQAGRDRARAELDRRQAEKDRARAMLDRANAEQQRKIAERNRAAAMADYK